MKTILIIALNLFCLFSLAQTKKASLKKNAGETTIAPAEKTDRGNVDSGEIQVVFSNRTRGEETVVQPKKETENTDNNTPICTIRKSRK